MSKTRKPTEGLSEEQNARLTRAKKEYEKIEEEIAPYVKRREVRKSSSAGQWRDASDYERLDFFHDLKKATKKLPSDHPSRSGPKRR